MKQPRQHFIDNKQSSGKYVSTVIDLDNNQTIEVYGGGQGDDMTIAQMIYHSLANQKLFSKEEGSE